MNEHERAAALEAALQQRRSAAMSTKRGDERAEEAALAELATQLARMNVAQQSRIRSSLRAELIAQAKQPSWQANWQRTLRTVRHGWLTPLTTVAVCLLVIFVASVQSLTGLTQVDQPLVARPIGVILPEQPTTVPQQAAQLALLESAGTNNLADQQPMLATPMLEQRTAPGPQPTPVPVPVPTS